MYRIEKKPNTPNIIWDAKNGRSLCHFVKGMMETDDKALADTLKTMGYTVTGGEAEKAEESAEEKPAAKKVKRKQTGDVNVCV